MPSLCGPGNLRGRGIRPRSALLRGLAVQPALTCRIAVGHLTVVHDTPARQRGVLPRGAQERARASRPTGSQSAWGIRPRSSPAPSTRTCPRRTPTPTWKGSRDRSATTREQCARSVASMSDRNCLAVAPGLGRTRVRPGQGLDVLRLVRRAFMRNCVTRATPAMATTTPPPTAAISRAIPRGMVPDMPRK